VYLKIVNALASPQTAAVTLTGAESVNSTGTAIVLSSANLTDTNTLAAPNKVAPVQSEITGLGKTFRHVFPPYSLTVLVLKAR
jgi:alpha-N-arabinofuranosidase